MEDEQVWELGSIGARAEHLHLRFEVGARALRQAAVEPNVHQHGRVLHGRVDALHRPLHDARAARVDRGREP